MVWWIPWHHVLLQLDTQQPSYYPNPLIMCNFILQCPNKASILSCVYLIIGIETNTSLKINLDIRSHGGAPFVKNQELCAFASYSKSPLGGGLPYHVRTDVSVRSVIFLVISIHSIHKGEVLCFSSVHLKRLLNIMK